jgi:uncharacterized membrane protein
MAIYFLALGLVLAIRQRPRAGAAIAVMAAVWLIVSVWVVVPAVRRAGGLPARNPFVEAIGASPSRVSGLPDRIASVPMLKTVLTLSASAGFLCWLAPEVFAVALPGLVVTSVANPHTAAVGITGHYLYPVLPWIFFAAALGAARLQSRAPMVLRAVSCLLLLGTIADSPLWAGVWRRSEDAGRAGEVRRQLTMIPPEAPLLTMPNLVPHVPHRARIWTLGIGAAPSEPVDYVAISDVGDPWPFRRDDVAAEVRRYATDPAFEPVANGPLYLFRRK